MRSWPRARQHKASDVLLKVGQPPAFRVGGDLHYMQADKLKPAQTQRLAEIVLSQSRFSGSIADLQEYDCSYAVPSVGRYRVNIFRQRQSLALAMRSIPLVIPTFDQLGTPAAVRSFAELERGLVLVVGAAGNGKSSTLAAMRRRDEPHAAACTSSPSKTRSSSCTPTRCPRSRSARSASTRSRSARPCARRCARTRRHPGRRDPRRRDHGDRAQGGRDRPSGALHAAHTRRGQDRRPRARAVRHTGSRRRRASASPTRSRASSRSASCRASMAV